MVRLKYISILLLCFSLSSNIFPQTAYEFLRLNTSPRAAALAGSIVAGDNDPNIIFYNPAGIALLNETPASFSFLKYLLDINAASFAITHKHEYLGSFSAGFQYINYGNFIEADQYGQRLGEFGAGDLALQLGYANQLDSNFYYGANIKYIYSSIAGKSSSAIAGDIGLHYSIPSENWNFSFSILNIGTQLSKYFDVEEKLPVDIRIGFSKQLARLPLRFYFSFIRLNEDEGSFIKKFRNIVFGGEFKISTYVKFRFGYDNQRRKDAKLSSTAGIAGFNFGFGVLVKEYNIDYSFSSLGSIGALHSFGISTAL